MQPISLSAYGSQSSSPSPVNRMMASFAETFREGIDINLGVGYVNESTIPKQDMLLAMREVIDHPVRHPFPFNYGGSRGADNLINAIRRFYRDNKIGGLGEGVPDGCEIIIGANGATSILEAIANMVEPGIVITTDPMYYIYCDYLMRRGFELVTVPEDENGMRTDILEDKINGLGQRIKDIRFIYTVTVGNPSGAILANDRRKQIVGTASGLSHKLGRIVPVFFDRAYEDLIHDSSVEPPLSGMLFDDIGCVHEIGTLSKVLAPALRIGYLIGPRSPFMQAMVQRTNDVGFSAPLISQEIAALLFDRSIQEQLETVRRGYREKAEIVGDALRLELGPYIETMTGGSAGFYFYLTFRDIETAEDSLFFRILTRSTGDEELDGPPDNLNPRVIYVPGEFCVHPQGDLAETGRRQLRLSYGFEETEKIVEAVRLMREAAEKVG